MGVLFSLFDSFTKAHWIKLFQIKYRYRLLCDINCIPYLLMTARDILFAGQGVLVKHLILSTADQTGMTLNASDQTVAVSGNSKPREWPEGGFTALGGHGSGALEADDSYKGD